jgi:pimeloyl-ACP methyl ester carboxylesterase
MAILLVPGFMADETLWDDMVPALARFGPVATSPHPRQRDNEALIERVRAMGTRLGGDVFRRQSMLDRPGDLERSGEIRCPTLVVAAAQEMTAAIPGATLVVVEDTGHMIPIEAPRRLLDAIVPWLAAHEEG